MKKNDYLCMECRYMTYDVLANAICNNPARGGSYPVISEYMPACFRFINKKV